MPSTFVSSRRESCARLLLQHGKSPQYGAEGVPFPALQTGEAGTSMHTAAGMSCVTVAGECEWCRGAGVCSGGAGQCRGKVCV